MAEIFSKKSAKQRARKEAGRQGLIGATAMEAVKAGEARTLAAERSRLAVANLLGAPGTYELPGTAGPSLIPGTAGADIYQHGTAATAVDPTAKAMLQYKSYGGKDQKEAVKKFEEQERTGILDPTKFTENVAQSADFRIRSRLTAESEQLLAQKGPAWDMLSNSTLGAIMEGAGVQMKEAVRELKNQAAKGGSARRTALNEAREMLARESAIQMRVQETWQANLKLFDFARANAERVQAGNQSFLNNLPMLRDTYTNTMNGLAEVMAGTVAQTASAASASGYQARAAVGDSQFAEKLITGTVSLLGSYLTGTSFNFMGGQDSPYASPGASSGASPYVNPNAGGSSLLQQGLDWMTKPTYETTTTGTGANKVIKGGQTGPSQGSQAFSSIKSNLTQAFMGAKR